jgi:undecaprenyl-diphosphatase
MDRSWLVALVVGTLQGIFEWLPISSEGNLTIVLTAIGSSPSEAVAYALFLHLGTAVSATLYYRGEIWTVLEDLPSWRPTSAFTETPRLSFLGIATLASGLVGGLAYLLLEELVSVLTGGAVIIGIGVLLIATGILQRIADDVSLGTRATPTFVDALLVGGLQGLAILPGISRSGVTTSALLFRGYDGPNSFELSFLLSIPAAIGGGLIGYLDTGLGNVTLVSAAISLCAAAVVGYLTIDALMRLVHRVAFWTVCAGLGLLAVIGGTLVLI